MANEIYQQVNAFDPRTPGARFKDAALGLLGVFVLFSSIVALPTSDYSSPSSFNRAILSLFLLLAGAILITVAVRFAQRANNTAFSYWLNAKKPTVQDLARIVYSPEEHSSVKERVVAELDKSHPNWRTQVAGTVAMRQGETGDNIPKLEYGPADFIYMAFVMVMGLASFGLALLAFTTGQVWLTTTAMITMIALVLVIQRRNKKDQAKYAKWKVDLLSQYSVVELIYLQALPNLKPEVTSRLHRVLSEEMPGWSQRADVPLWSALCKC